MIGRTIGAANTLRKLPVLRLSRKMKGTSIGGALTLVALLLLDAYFPIVGQLVTDPSVQVYIYMAATYLGTWLGGYLTPEDVRRFLSDDEIQKLLRD